MRRLRPFLDLTLPLIGGFILLDSYIVVTHLYHQIALAGVGFVVIIIGSWRLYDPLLPSKRLYGALRREVDDFLDLVRELNRESVILEQVPSQERLDVVNGLQLTMHEAVDRMTECAGLADHETAPLTVQTHRAQLVETDDEPVTAQLG